MCEIPGSAKRRGELEEEEDPEGKAGEKSEDRELEWKEELGEEETPEKDKLEEEQEKPGDEKKKMRAHFINVDFLFKRLSLQSQD